MSNFTNGRGVNYVKDVPTSCNQQTRRDLCYNVSMGKRQTLAIQWGMGYILITPPYSNDSCFRFKRSLTNNCHVIDTTDKLNCLNNITLHKQMGMMTIHIEKGNINVKCNRKGKLGPIVKDIKNQPSPRTTITTIINEAIDNRVIVKNELHDHLGYIRDIIKYINHKSNFPQSKILSSLINYGTPPCSSNKEAKITVLTHYGNGKLSCIKCGQLDIRTLSIDHINGGGYKHVKELGRLGHTLYKWLIKNNFPEGYQTLCMNCQWIKRSEKNEYFIRTSNGLQDVQDIPKTL